MCLEIQGIQPNLPPKSQLSHLYEPLLYITIAIDSLYLPCMTIWPATDVYIHQTVGNLRDACKVHIEQ